jgi:phage terminase large subunit GpA-like protein
MDAHVDATEGGVKIRRGARLWTVAVATFKSETYRFLRHDRPTDEAIAAGAGFAAGYLHLPQGTDAEWTRQLVAEQLVTVKTRRGFSKLEWQKLRERNEALDCRVYARAAAWIAGADRWSEGRWAELEKQLALGSSADEMETGHFVGTAMETIARELPLAGRLQRLPRRGHRVFRSSYLA